MAKPINILLTFEQVVGTNTAPLVAAQDWTEYTEGKRGKRLGTTYEILLLNNSCEKLRIHVEDLAPVISQDELDMDGLLSLRVQTKSFYPMRERGRLKHEKIL